MGLAWRDHGTPRTMLDPDTQSEGQMEDVAR